MLDTEGRYLCVGVHACSELLLVKIQKFQFVAVSSFFVLALLWLPTHFFPSLTLSTTLLKSPLLFPLSYIPSLSTDSGGMKRPSRSMPPGVWRDTSKMLPRPRGTVEVGR
jgi:hypothetical protein